jgi:alanine dehydrogenase
LADEAEQRLPQQDHHPHATGAFGAESGGEGAAAVEPPCVCVLGGGVVGLGGGKVCVGVGLWYICIYLKKNDASNAIHRH